MRSANSTIISFLTVLLIPFILNGCVLAVASTGATTAVSSDSRNIDTMVDDEMIEQKASEILKTNHLLSDEQLFSVSVYSVSGNVLMVGQTVHKEYIDWCVSEIKKLDSVRKIYNYVEYRKPVEFSVVSSDSYITSKIRTKLLFGEKISSGHFKVVTENSNVYLMGYVTRDESNRAVNVAKSVDGVQKVYTIFDYFDYPTTPDRADGKDNIEIEVVDVSQPAQASSSGAANSSSYVAPASSSDNGGASLVNDSSGLLEP